MPLTWAIWCPRGDECKRGGSMFAKGPSESAVRERLARHLSQAPGHGPLEWDEAELVAGLAEVVSWEDDKEEAGGDDGASSEPIGAVRNRKRPRRGPQGQELGPQMSASIAAAVSEGIQEGIQVGLFLFFATEIYSHIVLSLPNDMVA